jgi:hypothetical protein
MSFSKVISYEVDEPDYFLSKDGDPVFTTKYRLVLGPSQPLIQWGPEALSLMVQWLQY